jgi:hypothetical protein
LDGVCKSNDDDACTLLGVESEASFVSRAGKTISFPGIVATIDPGVDKKISTNKLDTEDIGHELLEVFIEAIADAKYLVPGAPTSTACRNITSIEGLCQAEEDAEKISAVNESAARAEASARAVVSILVRGGWLFSLNNESLADWIETLAAVTSRKIAEAAQWSKQVCNGAEANLHADEFSDINLEINKKVLNDSMQ